jgi:tetratricopeptide (TPR) repeat protein
MDFNPNNNIIKLCIEGMGNDEKGKPAEASRLFLQAWKEATNDFEKFLAAYYVARHQENTSDKLKWFETSLQFALKINDVTVTSAFPSLYSNIAKCYEDLGNLENAKKNYELANSFKEKISDRGPFYHGTKADLQIGDVLTPGRESNYKSEFIMNHIYFTALVHT